MSQFQRIAILAGQDLGYCRGLFRGIHAYASHRMRWVFRDAPPDMQVLGSLREWQPDGIIAHLFEKKFARHVIALRKPLVNTTNTLMQLKVPLVEVDHRRVGQLAAQHFIERNFTNFGYFGSRWTGFSRQREQGFREALKVVGHTVSSCYAEYLPRPAAGTSWNRVDFEVRDWLLVLPKPVAILASNDLPARHLAELCRSLDLLVPEQVALLGVDNDQLECLLCNPPLSSVVNPSEQIGYEAAKLLDRLMSGHRPPSGPILVPPSHIITRQSTDVVAVADAEVSAAVRFIRDHAAENINAARVVHALSVARRGLERRFRDVLGRTILQEIQRVRVERAKHLLVETDLPMPVVAARSGFSSPQRLATVFRQLSGMSPLSYRAHTRLRP
jgi:LacI family transcriptional regulator